jgi:hypothetical protein
MAGDCVQSTHRRPHHRLGNQSHPRKAGKRVTKDQTRQVLSDDVVHLRQKATYYASLHLFEAQKYAERLASNIELALTTLPSDEDPQIS